MTRFLTTAASALALTFGAALAQDGYTPPADDDAAVTTAPSGDDLYTDDAYAEPQGDANADEGEALEEDVDGMDGDDAEHLPSPYDEPADADVDEDLEIEGEMDEPSSEL